MQKKNLPPEGVRGRSNSSDPFQGAIAPTSFRELIVVAWIGDRVDDFAAAVENQE